jgi:hypothetical protein
VDRLDEFLAVPSSLRRQYYAQKCPCLISMRADSEGVFAWCDTTSKQPDGLMTRMRRPPGGAVFHALAMRGVSHHEALRIANELEHGQSVKDIEIELVFTQEELEAQMSALDVKATWKGGEPRKPFTVDLRKLKEPWTVAVRRALINWGQPEDEATAIAHRVAGGETVEAEVGVGRTGGTRH